MLMNIKTTINTPSNQISNEISLMKEPKYYKKSNIKVEESTFQEKFESSEKLN